MKFLEHNFESQLRLIWDNRAKLLFHSVLFNKFQHRTNLIAFSLAILYLKDNFVLTYLKNLSPKFSSHTNFDSEWENENEFRHRTSLTVLFLVIWGSGTTEHTQNFYVFKS
jgi:hypothetical protein